MGSSASDRPLVNGAVYAVEAVEWTNRRWLRGWREDGTYAPPCPAPAVVDGYHDAEKRQAASEHCEVVQGGLVSMPGKCVCDIMSGLTRANARA